MTFLSALESYFLKNKPLLDKYGLLTIKKDDGLGLGAIMIISNDLITIRVDLETIKIFLINFFLNK